MAKNTKPTRSKKSPKRTAKKKAPRAIPVTNKVRALPASGRFGRPRGNSDKPPFTATIYFETKADRDAAFTLAQKAGLSLSAYVRGRLANG